jgi:hypothetical protein
MSNKKDEKETNEEQQKKQIENTTDNVQDTNNKIKSQLVDYQSENRKKIQQNIHNLNQFQEEFIKSSKEFSNNYIELQKNMINVCQSSYSQMLNNVYRTYWNNFMIPERYVDVYNKVNENRSENITNSSKIVNGALIGIAEMFNNTLELTQKFYLNAFQNYFNYVKKIEKYYNN